MAATEDRLVALLDRLEDLLGEIRSEVRARRPDAAAKEEVVEAFADETFRARDA